MSDAYLLTGCILTGTPRVASVTHTLVHPRPSLAHAIDSTVEARALVDYKTEKYTQMNIIKSLHTFFSVVEKVGVNLYKPPNRM